MVCRSFRLVWPCERQKTKGFDKGGKPSVGGRVAPLSFCRQNGYDYYMESPHTLACKRAYSSVSKIPSRDLPEDAYEVYLNVATEKELEKDILFDSTLNKILTATGGIIWK